MFSGLLHDLIGDGWIKNLGELEKLKDHIDKEEVWKRFLDIKKENKHRLVMNLKHFKEEKGINLWDYIEKYHKSYVVINGLTMDDAMKYWNLAYFIISL